MSETLKIFIAAKPYVSAVQEKNRSDLCWIEHFGQHFLSKKVKKCLCTVNTLLKITYYLSVIKREPFEIFQKFQRIQVCLDKSYTPWNFENYSFINKEALLKKLKKFKFLYLGIRTRYWSEILHTLIWHHYLPAP